VSVPGRSQPTHLRGPAGELWGRRRECELLDRLLDAVRAGESQALVVHGEPGVGKTALLDYLVEQATGCRVARVAGVQSEMELAFAGLHQLDDAQWLDHASAQVLGLVARRLAAESVGLVFGARVPSDELAGLPALVVEGLAEANARALLEGALTGPLDTQVQDRLVAETRGNPLALLELPRGLTPAELAGGFALPDAMPLSASIEESFRRRLDALPAGTRGLLLVAAADPVGDPALVWRAAERLGIGTKAGGRPGGPAPRGAGDRSLRGGVRRRLPTQPAGGGGRRLRPARRWHTGVLSRAVADTQRGNSAHSCPRKISGSSVERTAMLHPLRRKRKRGVLGSALPGEHHPVGWAIPVLGRRRGGGGPAAPGRP
jgi:hypothetical protein